MKFDMSELRNAQPPVNWGTYTDVTEVSMLLRVK